MTVEKDLLDGGKGATLAGEGDTGAGLSETSGGGDGRAINPEEIELQQAEADLAKSEGGQPPAGDAGDDKAIPDGDKEDKSLPARTEANAEVEGKGDEVDHEPKVVPVSVVKKLRTDLAKERHMRAQLEGSNATLQMMLRSGKPEGTPNGEPEALTPQDKIADVKQRKLALSSKFDDGDITATQMETERQKLEDEEWELRSAMLAPQQQTQPDLGLEEHAASLEERYPILIELTAGQLAPLKDLAYAQAQRDGKPIQPGPIGTKELRERMANLAGQFYGSGTTDPATTSQTTDPTLKAGLSRTGQARAAKTELAESLPPDAGKLGSAAPAGGVSEADLEAQLQGATEEEQIALLERHPSLVRKVLGA